MSRCAQGVSPTNSCRNSPATSIPPFRSPMLAKSATAAGEQFWPMPLPADLRSSLKSAVADLANIGDRNGGVLVAGLFLQEFVGDTPWAHLDIAGPAFNEGQGWGYTPTGGTGVGVRTLLTLLEG